MEFRIFGDSCFFQLRQRFSLNQPRKMFPNQWLKFCFSYKVFEQQISLDSSLSLMNDGALNISRIANMLVVCVCLQMVRLCLVLRVVPCASPVQRDVVA